MKNRFLGQIKTEIFPIGVGAMSFSDFYGPVTKAQSHDILNYALEFGVNHLDTSDLYGNGVSEERIGSFLKNNPSSRDFFKIATKGGIEKIKSGKTRFNNSNEYLRKSLENSLKRLNLDNIELYYVHRLDSNRPIEEITNLLASFVKEGKVKQIGFSEISPTSLVRASKVHPVGAIQSEYSLSTRYPELGLVQRTLELETTLVAFSPVGRSLLTDKPLSYNNVKLIPFLKENPRFSKENIELNTQATMPFRVLAAEMGVSAATLAIAWLLNRKPHVVPIPGTRSVENFKSLVEGAHLKLTKSDLQTIERILPLGWAHGDRYSINQWVGPEKYC